MAATSETLRVALTEHDIDDTPLLAPMAPMAPLTAKMVTMLRQTVYLTGMCCRLTPYQLGPLPPVTTANG